MSPAEVEHGSQELETIRFTRLARASKWLLGFAETALPGAIGAFRLSSRSARQALAAANRGSP
jgi:hypothetical protein